MNWGIDEISSSPGSTLVNLRFLSSFSKILVENFLRSTAAFFLRRFFSIELWSPPIILKLLWTLYAWRTSVLYYLDGSLAKREKRGLNLISFSVDILFSTLLFLCLTSEFNLSRIFYFSSILEALVPVSLVDSSETCLITLVGRVSECLSLESDLSSFSDRSKLLPRSDYLAGLW